MDERTGASRHILNVHDDAAARARRHAALQAAGYDVRDAATGAAALRDALDGPDLILLDLYLPWLQSFEVLQRLRESPRTRGIPVAVTGRGQAAHTWAVAAAAGARVYVDGSSEDRVVAAANDLLDPRPPDRRAGARQG